MKTRKEAVPYSAETFRNVPVVQLDGQATKIPVNMTEQQGRVDAHGRILHIVMTKNAFCAWRGSGVQR